VWPCRWSQLLGGIWCFCPKEHLGSCCRAVDARRDCGFSSNASGYVVSWRRHNNYRGPSAQSHSFWGFPKVSCVTGSLGISGSSICSSNMQTRSIRKLLKFCKVRVGIYEKKNCDFLRSNDSTNKITKTWRRNSVFRCEQNLHCVITVSV
jgi:hypothetical protein